MIGFLWTKCLRWRQVGDDLNQIERNNLPYASNYSKIESNKNEGDDQMKTISIRLDDHDYDMLGEMLKNMGQTKQTFYETYTKTVLRLRKIPFVIEDPIDPFYSDSNMTRLTESEQQFREGKVIVKTMDELEAMAK